MNAIDGGATIEVSKGAMDKEKLQNKIDQLDHDLARRYKSPWNKRTQRYSR
jgi:hypothetical protein